MELGLCFGLLHFTLEQVTGTSADSTGTTSSFRQTKKQVQPIHSGREQLSGIPAAGWSSSRVAVSFKVLNVHRDMLLFCSKSCYVCSRGGVQTLEHTNRSFPVAPKQEMTHSCPSYAREGTALSLETKDIPLSCRE